VSQRSARMIPHEQRPGHSPNTDDQVESPRREKGPRVRRTEQTEDNAGTDNPLASRQSQLRDPARHLPPNAALSPPFRLEEEQYKI
jgi:hypothetical protein